MPTLKLMLHYEIRSNTEAEFDLDVDEYAIWCIAKGYDLETALNQEHLILAFLQTALTLEDVSDRLNWGEDVTNLWHAQIITEKDKP